jgi:hypothetical protein
MKTAYMPWGRSYPIFAFSFFLLASVFAGAQTIDCTQVPYNVPAGLPTASITAAQDQAQMMCQQKLQFPTPASNPPLTATRESDPNKPLNAWPGNVSNTGAN